MKNSKGMLRAIFKVVPPDCVRQGGTDFREV
jgi:hypothetical protein